jgi:integrase
MRGTIRAKGKDSWQISFYTGKVISGKRERYFETVHAHRKSDAQLVVNERILNLTKNVALPKGRITVTECLNQWLEGYVKTNCSQRTYDGYKSIIDHHLLPDLGHVKLRELQAPIIQKYYGKACEDLSSRTVHHIHRVLSQALRYSVRHGMLGRNPCEDVDPPSPKKKTMRTLTPSEVDVLLENAQEHLYYPIIYTAVSSGLRQAELLGLRWRDLDLDYCTISVSQVLVLRKGEYSYAE